MGLRGHRACGALRWSGAEGWGGVARRHTALHHSPGAHHCLSSTSDGDSDVDSELEDRVDGVKSWLSKNKGSSKALSDDGSLKGSSRWVQVWALAAWRGLGIARGVRGRVNLVSSLVSAGGTYPSAGTSSAPHTLGGVPDPPSILALCAASASG